MVNVTLFSSPSVFALSVCVIGFFSQVSGALAKARGRRGDDDSGVVKKLRDDPPRLREGLSRNG